jgi:hypothetical protein
VCGKGWVGENCASLALGNTSIRSIANIPASVNGTVIKTVWGGHSVMEHGLSHWFGSVIMNGSSLSGWSTESALGHAVASFPSGTYTMSEIVVSPREGSQNWDNGSIHGGYLVKNPRPWTNHSDQWLFFYTGFPEKGSLATRKIGVAYASTLAGPWVRWGTPVFCASSNASHIDNSSVSNPAPAFFADGSGKLLLAYKGLGVEQPSKPPCTDGSGKACIFVASAAHWTGPYQRLALEVTDLNSVGSTSNYIFAEDPTSERMIANCVQLFPADEFSLLPKYGSRMGAGI